MSDFLSAGRLEDHPFAAIAGQIFQGSQTGELILESGNRRRTVWFLGGNPVAVVSDDAQDHLAQFLLEHGKISDDDARRLADLPETREALGSADFLPKETLNWGVKSRFVNLCYDLFRWEEGDYGFHEGEPPRELFLLKVPAHTLIFKGISLLGQAAIIDAVPDDAVCAAGSVAPVDARYLNPDALRLLERCQPGRTVAEALGGDSADLTQSRRLLYALSCLGLVALARGRASTPAAASVPDFDPGFMLDEDDTIAAAPAPASEKPRDEEAHAESPLDTMLSSDQFGLNLPPLDAGYGSAAGVSINNAISPAPPSGGHQFAEESGSTSFGALGTETTFINQAEPPAPAVGEQEAAAVVATPSGRKFHIHRIAGITLGALAAAGIIAFAGWWWLSGSEPAPPPVKPPVKRPATVPAPVAATPDPVPGAITPAVVPAPAPTTQSAPVPPAPTATAPAAPAPASGVKDPAPRPAAVSAGASGTDRYRNALELSRAGDLDGAAATWEALLAEEHRSAFTVQVLTACQHDTVRDAQRALTGQDLYLVAKKVNGRSCYRICLGTFDSREAAARALLALPGEYRTSGAAVRAVADALNKER